MNKYIYKSAINNIKFSENLNEKIINNLTRDKSNNRKKQEKDYSRLVSAMVLVLGIFFITISIPKTKIKSDFEFELSKGNLSVKYIDESPGSSTSGDLIWLTEEELFHKFQLDIFKGEIKDLKNIEINYNGSIDYRAIAWVKVKTVYKGDLDIGETISILLQGPINVEGLWVEDTEVMSNLKVGMTGIFTPLKYDEESYREENGVRLYLKELADYGFMDGERYMFLETGKGLIFYREAYESIKSANTLDEIEDYVKRMIK